MMHRSLIGIFGPTCIFVTFLMVTSCMDMPLTPAQVRDNHNDMFHAVEAYINQPELFVNGEWQQHWGDGSFFGPLSI